MSDKEWDHFISEIFKPQFESILSKINHLFEIEKAKTETKKNVELTRIYLPIKDFEALEEGIPEFREFHNLGGIPCVKSKREKISIDIEVVNPRKRKKKAIVYVNESR